MVNNKRTEDAEKGEERKSTEESYYQVRALVSDK